MSTFLIEPGAKLANRYRLDQAVSETGGATRWKATDETLARPVAVWTFAEGFPRTSEVVRAARATSRVTDARVTQVFDADDTSSIPYVVEEWVVGSSLADLLRQGPLEPERAAGLVAEAAEAIAAAHASGLHHLCLTPSKLMWSNGGAVKVTGIGVDAALQGVSSADPAASDAQGLGNLLYAALTGLWPGGPANGLPAAPQGPAGAYPPGQIRQGVNEPLSTITIRSALPHLVGQMVPGPAITSPAEFCAAMAEVPRIIPLPVAPTETVPPPEPGTSRRTGEFGSTGPRRSARSSQARDQRAEPSRTERRATGGRVSPRQIAVGAMAVVLFAAVIIGAWTVGSMISGAGDEEDPTGTETAQPSEEPVELETVAIQASAGLNPHGNTDEHSDTAPRSYDGDPSSAWKTQGYRDPLSIIKPGVGLRLDLGESYEIGEIVLDMGGEGYEFDIRVGDVEGASENDFEVVQQASGGSQTIELEEPASGRYLLIWFTELPQQSDGDYRGLVNEIEVRGS